MSNEKRFAPIDRLPPDVREIADTMMKLLMMYFPGREQIEMCVGRSAKAILKFEGAPITREMIEDTMAHLAFYKRYYPKSGEPDTMALDSPEKILDALVAAWEVHRETMRQELSAVNSSALTALERNDVEKT